MGAGSFVLNRLTGLGVLAYLYLHLAVLSQLARGPEAWDAFVELASSPVVLVLDVVLVAALLLHAVNGLHLALVGLGVATGRRASVAGAAVVGVTVLVVAAIRLVASGP